ncbi:MAG: nucleoside triphosphate pyrophosphohydrolase [Anaerolineaceae bacterium]|nr:nucleoside triphosphate pyrophosphohydrolase [Anaerolineaceae bacterium]
MKEGFMYLNEIRGVLELLDIDKIRGIHIIDGNQLYERHTLMHNPDSYSIYAIDIVKERIDKLIELINNTYTGNFEVNCFYMKDLSWKKETVKINSLKNILMDKQRVYVLFPPKEGCLSMIEFQELISRLRAPDGCPWDRKQTHRTLRTNLLEEAYEVLDAIDKNDSEHLREELGDLLLQIVLHSQIATENGEFSLSEVIYDIHKKITNRHPHVFGEIEIDGVQDVMKNWEKIKSEERSHREGNKIDSILSSIPKQLPSLSVAQKYQERVARVGFDWEEISPVFGKVDEELAEVKSAKTKEALEEELGDLLFAVVNLVRWKGFDAESALRLTNAKFRSRFEYIEKTTSAEGKSLTDLTLIEMDTLWEEAKQNEIATRAQNEQ